ncbi:Retinoic acid induced 16-like protein-domain-containing protein [Lipomyces tetrasporus]|uniref:Retinoic acid induced 16-like protein-domain-containing protein n=1 Tax=Lipomyces tetrasporus TaxID=54092 RepID=A0AAD7QVJ4_9ASCO|nr:Retinoic acid induced 16-like protein-domain-containing protein [Lipomyces tetrasporus]KAJ8102093.1 Retinoic acid induced 16-like protein-domain-containing protein [Lipomyces tetrasporus]
MSFWGLWRRPAAVADDKRGTAAIEKAWISLTKEEEALRDGSDPRAQDKVARHIMEIADIIRAEEQTSTQRISLQYALDHGLFTKIAAITQLCGPSIIKESVAAFSILIKSGEEDLMSNDQVIKSIDIFLCELARSRGERVLEEEFAEMLFSVASRLRAEPQSLMKWIHSSRSTPVNDMPEELLNGRSSSESNYQSPGEGQKVEDEDMPEMVYELPPESNTDNQLEGSRSALPESHMSAEHVITEDAHSASIDTEADIPAHVAEQEIENTTGDENLQDEVCSKVEGLAHEQVTNSSRCNESLQEDEDNPEAASRSNMDDTVDIIDDLIRDLHIDQKINDFPLFYFLLEFIHHDGRAGEFARTGLLYIVESAWPSSPLEQWIIDSDFGTLMASGLGALYSQLSRTMLRAFQTKAEPKVVSMAKESERKFVPVAIGENAPGQDDPQEIESNKLHLQMFLSYLEFWQDTLSHCRSEAIRNTLLDNFETLFLKQLLVPSLAESADEEGSVSGGAAIAVLTYLRAIFESLGQKDIVSLILSSLIVNKESIPSTREPKPRAVSEYGSEDGVDERIPIKMTATSFSMVDLITDSLESSSQETIIAALRLVSTLVRKHYPYTLNTLFQVTQLANKFAPTVTPFNVYSQEIDFFLSLMPANETEELSSQVYDSYLKDSRLALESHAYLPTSVAHSEDVDDVVTQYLTSEQMPKLYSHTLNVDDHTWNDLLRLFSLFFANSVELNLVLTRVFIDLVSCGWISLRGWMLVNLRDVEVSHVRPQLDSDDDDNMVGGTNVDVRADDDLQSDVGMQGLREYADDMSDSEDEYWGTTPEERYEETTFKRMSPMMDVLQALNKKIDEYRQKIPVFDDKLAERRQMLKDDDDQIGDPAAVAFSSPVADARAKALTAAESKRFSLSPMDTQQRAEQIYWSSSTTSSPAQLRQPVGYRSVSVSSLSEPRSATRSSTVRSRPPQPQPQTSPLAFRQHRRAESIAGELPSAHSNPHRSVHRRSQTTFTGSPFLSPTSTIQSDFATPLRGPPVLRTMKSHDSLRAFESLMSSPPLERVSSTTVQATTPASFSASRFLKGNDYGSSLKAANRLGSSPSEFASSLLMNDDIHDPFASEDEADGRVEPAGAGEGKRDRGIEMDDIVHDIEYVPAVIQVMGPETGKSRYVSVAHLLGNVIVFEVSVFGPGNFFLVANVVLTGNRNLSKSLQLWFKSGVH